MTPKEKADDLFLKYRSIIAGKQFLTGFVLMSEANELTKQAALIAVELALEHCNGKNINEEFDKTLYLIEVKHEIEKL